MLFNQAKQGDVEVVTMLLRECSFPALLRRRNFIDATTNWWTARRLLKRWFWLREREAGVRIHGPTVLIEYDSIVPPDTRFPADFDHIHTVTRVPGNDFGEDWLRRHHLEHHQKA